MIEKQMSEMESTPNFRSESPIKALKDAMKQEESSYKSPNISPLKKVQIKVRTKGSPERMLKTNDKHMNSQ